MSILKSITKASAVCWIASLLVIGALFTAFFINEKLSGFESRLALAKRVHSEYRRDILRDEVDTAIKFISFEFARRQAALAADSRNPMSASARKALAERETLETLKALKIGRRPEGDLFVVNHYGVLLSMPAANGKEPELSLDRLNGGAYKQFLEGARQPEGVFSKLKRLPSAPPESFYAKRIDDPAWIVCASVSDVQLAAEISESASELKTKMLSDIAFIILASLLVVAGALWLSWSVSRAVKREIDLLVSYCHGSAAGKERLSEGEFYFDEFKFIASSLISMVRSINSLVGTVKDLALRSEAGNQAKSGFITSLRRELGGPVNGIMDMVRILKDSHLDRAQHECVAAIDVSVQSLARLSGDIQDFSVDSEGRLQIVERPFDLGHLVCDIASRMESLAKESGDVLEVKVPTIGLPDLVSGDEGKIAQTLQTLVANAIKFTKAGKVTVELSRDGASPSGRGHLFKFSVADTGLGISEGKLKRIFEFSGDAIGGKFGGVSLGLAVAKGMVEAMGGTMEAASEKGKGSIFSFTVPLEETAA